MTPPLRESALPGYNRRSRPREALTHYLQYGFSHLMMYVFGRFNFVRSAMAWIYSRRLTIQPRTSGTTTIENVNCGMAAAEIARDGIYAGLTLRKEIVDQFVLYTHTATCYGDKTKDFGFLYKDKGIIEQESGCQFSLGRYDYTLNLCPALRSLASDPQLIAIARGYLQAEPVLIGARMWWSFAASRNAAREEAGGQQFHYDLDGYRAVTFFFYLTDTGPDSGPHLYIRGSHIQKPLKHLVSIYKQRSDAEIEKHYAPERQFVVCGRAGFGFAEDTFGYHKGLPPENGDRLVVQVRYGLRDYGTGRED
jgi:hypothetical protein